jgi:SAM-dependent methyltransferase
MMSSIGLIDLVKKIITSSITLKSVIFKLFTILSVLKARKARKIFESAPEMPVWLGRDILEELQQRYKSLPKRTYNAENLEERGKDSARRILNLIHAKTKNMENIDTFLELGCFDGMVSCTLQRMGKVTTAIDNRSEWFDERGIRAGVKFHKMDAAHLQFNDEEFDFVFSYDAFEHFADPKLVLQEAIRVVKIGGYIYLCFGPLYMSPMGLHAYRSITVPYCQFFFPKDLLQDFANANGLRAIDFDHLNCWALEDFRKLWDMYTHRLKKIIYYERYVTSHLGLIMKFPSCFRSKTKCFDNLVISSIEVLFKKIK